LFTNKNAGSLRLIGRPDISAIASVTLDWGSLGPRTQCSGNRVGHGRSAPALRTFEPGNPARGVGLPFDRREKVRGLDRLGEVIVHPGGEAAVAILAPRPGGQGDDGPMTARRLLPLSDRLNDLKAVELRHVDVEEQDVDIGGRGGLDSGAMAADPEEV
jgi:hypothetical protein